MSFAIANGIKLCYEMKGEGFPVIFIHGFGSKKEIWKPQVVEISKKFKVIIFDLRGTGESDRPDIPYTMKMMADDVNGLLEALRAVTISIYPFMPRTAKSMWGQMALADFDKIRFEDVKRFGLIAPGTVINKGAPLFPRIK